MDKVKSLLFLFCKGFFFCSNLQEFFWISVGSKIDLQWEGISRRVIVVLFCIKFVFLSICSMKEL